MRDSFLSSTPLLSAADQQSIANTKENAGWHTRLHAAAKRFLDVALMLLALPCLLPFLLIIGLLIKRDSSGPIFYRGRRIGKDGRIFHILKFRTMYETPASYRGAKVTARDDPRITPIGRWLRTAKLNELPQLWNVLKGDMSLVGPRPEDPDIAAEWPADIRDEILSIRPGITSPASIVYRHEESLLSSGQVMSTYLESIVPSKLRLDQLYTRHHSLWVDLDVLFWTLVLVVVPGLGEYQPPEARLFLGPLARLRHRYLRGWFRIDLATTLLATFSSVLLWRAFGPLDIGWWQTGLSATFFALLFTVTGALFGLHDIVWSRAMAADIFDLLPAVGLATAVTLGLNHLLALFPPGLVITAAAFSLAGFAVSRYRSRLISGLTWRLLRRRRGPKAARERALIIGGGESGQLAAWLLSRHHRLDTLHVVGFVDDDLYKHGIRLKGVKVLGQRADIPELVQRHDVGIILFAIHNIPSTKRQSLLDICHRTQARVVALPDFLGTLKKIVAVPSDRDDADTADSSGHFAMES